MNSKDRLQCYPVDKKNVERSSQNVNKNLPCLPLFPGSLNGLGSATHNQKDKGVKGLFYEKQTFAQRLTY